MIERPESEWKAVAPREWDGGTSVDAANEYFNAISPEKTEMEGR